MGELDKETGEMDAALRVASPLSNQIWRSWMGWRVTWMVFAIIFLIQATVSSPASIER